MNLSGLDHLKFKVNKRAMRDRLALLIPCIKRKYAKRKTSLESLAKTRPSSRRDILQENLADEKGFEVKKKERKKE